MEKNTEKYAVMLARLHRLPIPDSLPFWAGEGMTDRELNRALHQMHTADPEVRREAIRLLSEAFGDNIDAWLPGVVSENYDSLKAIAAKVGAELEKKFDVVCRPSWTFFTTHESEGREENPRLLVYGVGEDMEDARKYLRAEGWFI